MSESLCPECGAQIGTEAINIAEGVALCPACGKLSRLSDVVSGQRPIQEILQKPPRGCSITDLGQSVVVRATLRSISGFLGSVFIALFWNGIVSVFVLLALSGLYTNLIGPLPAWFPAPDVKNGMPLGMTLFLCCFLIPFVTIGSVLIGAVLLNGWGKIEVHIADDTGVVSTGIGFLRWRRRFDPNQVTGVSMGVTPWESNGRSSPLIVIEADRTIKFGSLLEDKRRQWVRALLHEILLTTDLRERQAVILKAMPSDSQF